MMTGDVAVLVNPHAGRGRHRMLVDAVCIELAGSGHPVRVLDGDGVDAALEACQKAVAAGAAALVAMGGDGTVHLAMQAVAGTDVPIGIVAAGTGNDFATELALPTSPVVAAKAAAKALAEGRTRRIDLAKLDGPDGYSRWFGAVLGAGFDAVVNERANGMRWPRGPRRYDLAILAELARLKARRYELTLDGVRLDVDAVIVAVGNTASYGGGLRICPAADPTDGLLDVVVGARMSRVTLMSIKPKVRVGAHVHHRLVSSYRARTVTLAADGITTYADGERACSLPVTITAVPAALHILASE